MKYQDIIYDENQVRDFVRTVVQPLQLNEVYFVSASARTKYLTEEERRFYNLGRTEMYARHLVREATADRFVKVLRRMETHEMGYQTKNGHPIPEHARIVYLNINPSDMMGAMNAFQKEALQLQQNIARLAMEGNDYSDRMAQIRKLDLLLLKHVQNTRGTKHYIDVDFDLPEGFGFETLGTFLDRLSNNGVHYHIISTKSGYHVLLRKDTLAFNFHESLQETHNMVSNYGGEVAVNKNDMVPMPGTWQANHKVKLVR